MFNRIATELLEESLSWSPATAILGARQIGKTTLAKQLAAKRPDSMYLDLERPQTLAMLGEPEAFFINNRHRLIVLDEVQNAPQLFSVLRGEIDNDRRAGRFLMLGSASFQLLQQTQSLAGRLTLVDMAPLMLSEVMREFIDMQTLWLRGGFPNSFTAPSEPASWRWREAFVRHFLNTDLPALGIAVEPELMRRFWRMLAHLHGQLFNASSIAASLGVTQPTTARYLDHLVNTLMIRRLEPYHANLGKRLVKSPKVYVRDSGLLHLLLNIQTVNDLHGHPSTGASWEGFVVEHICNLLPPGTHASFYRTAAGAELDVVVQGGDRKIGFEIKFSSVPKVTKGFWQACTDVGVEAAYIVAPVQMGWSVKSLGAYPVNVISPTDIQRLLNDTFASV